MVTKRVIQDGDASKVENWATPNFDDEGDNGKKKKAEILKTIDDKELANQIKNAKYGKKIVQSEDVTRIGVWDEPGFSDAEGFDHINPKHEKITRYTIEEFESLEGQNKSYNRVNPTEDFTSIALWDLPIFDQFGNSEPVEIQPEKVKMPTAEELKTIQQTAHDEAYKEGLAQGQAEGFEQGKKEGFDAGLEEGREQGKEQAYAETRAALDEQAQKLQDICNTLAAPLDELDYDVEQQLVSMAMAVAKHLVRRELRTDVGQIVAAVRQAVSILPINARDVRVYLHPEDATLIREHLSMNEQAQDEQRWKIIEDATLTRGGCNVETQHSRIDATVETRLAAIIAQALGGERESDHD